MAVATNVKIASLRFEEIAPLSGRHISPSWFNGLAAHWLQLLSGPRLSRQVETQRTPPGPQAHAVPRGGHDPPMVNCVLADT